MNNDTQTQPTPKQALGGEGNILVWRNEAGETFLHHTNGLTIGLNQQERQDLLAWLLKEQAEELQ